MADENNKSKQIGLRVDAETRELIEGELEWGDHISEWVREAIRMRIEQEGLSGEGNPRMMTASS